MQIILKVPVLDVKTKCCFFPKKMVISFYFSPIDSQIGAYLAPRIKM